MKPSAKSQTLVRRALGGHAAIGLLAGALLYIVLLTGTLAVIHERWQRWERPSAPEMTVIAPVSVQRALVTGMAARPNGSRPANLYLQLPTEASPVAVLNVDGENRIVDPNGRLTGSDTHPWTDFILALHEYLTLPSALGLILVGMLGVMWIALSLTGVIAHPRIFRDAFRLRARGNRQLAQADWHNRLGVWTLPFALAVGLTGAFLGLAGVGAGLIAKAYHGGDITRTYSAIFGIEAPGDTTPAPLPNAARALDEMRLRFPNAVSSYVAITAPGTAGQRMTILADHPKRLIYGETYRFDAAGRYLGKVGLSDGALGQQIAASTYKLHFGNFGGLAMELAYLLLGLAATAVCGTGTSLWLQKRRRRGEASPRLEAMWALIVWGVPALLVATYWAAALIAPSPHLTGLFWTGLAIGLAGAAARPDRVRPPPLRLMLAGILAVTAAAHPFLVGNASMLSIMDLCIGGIAAILALAGYVPSGAESRGRRLLPEPRNSAATLEDC